MTTIRQVTLQAPDTNITQDYVISGFGTPQAAIVICGAVTDSSWGGHGAITIGYWDGTYQGCCGYGFEDNQTPSSNQGSRFSSGTQIVLFRVDGASVRRSATISNITDGVQLSWAEADMTQLWTTVILIKGATAVKAGFDLGNTSDGQTEVIPTTGCNPDLILFVARNATGETGQSSLGRYAVGFAYDEGGTLHNRCRGLRYASGDPNDFNAHVSDINCIAWDIGTGGSIVGAEVTAMGTEDFDLKSNGGSAGVGFFYLAIEMPEEVEVFTATTPTSAQNFDPFTSSFTPQWVFMLPTAEITLNVNRGGNQRVVEEFGMYSVINNNPGSGSTEEAGHYVIHENGSTDISLTFSNSEYNNRLEVNGVTGTPSDENLLEGDLPVFDSSGIVYSDANFQHDSTARLLLGFAMQEESGVVITDVNTTESWNDGDTGLIITGTGFV